MSDLSVPSPPSLSPANLPLSLQALRSGGDAAGTAATVKAAKDFESVFLHRVVDEMKQTIGSSGLLESPAGEQVMDLFWYHLAEDLGSKGGLGLWKQVYRQMTGGQNPPAGAEGLP